MNVVEHSFMKNEINYLFFDGIIVKLFSVCLYEEDM